MNSLQVFLLCILDGCLGSNSDQHKNEACWPQAGAPVECLLTCAQCCIWTGYLPTFIDNINPAFLAVKMLNIEWKSWLILIYPPFCEYIWSKLVLMCPVCLYSTLIPAGYSGVCPCWALCQHRPWQLLSAGRQAGFEVGGTGRLCRWEHTICRRTWS